MMKDEYDEGDEGNVSGKDRDMESRPDRLRTYTDSSQFDKTNHSR